MWTKSWTYVFIVALFIIAQRGNNFNNKGFLVHSLWHISTMEYYTLTEIDVCEEFLMICQKDSQ